MTNEKKNRKQGDNNNSNTSMHLKDCNLNFVNKTKISVCANWSQIII